MNIRTRLRTAFEGIVYACNWLGSVWIFVMMLIVVFDVALRFLGAPVNGANEIIQASIVAVLYMQIAHTLKEGKMTRSTAVYDLLRRKHPTLGGILGAAINLSGAALMALVTYNSWFKWLEALERKYFIGAQGVFTIPEWPIKFTIFLGSAFLLIQFLLMAFDELFGRASTSKTADTHSEGSLM